MGKCQSSHWQHPPSFCICWEYIGVTFNCEPTKSPGEFRSEDHICAYVQMADAHIIKATSRFIVQSLRTMKIRFYV